MENLMDEAKNLLSVIEKKEEASKSMGYMQAIYNYNEMLSELLTEYIEKREAVSQIEDEAERVKKRFAVEDELINKLILLKRNQTNVAFSHFVKIKKVFSELTKRVSK